MTDARQMISQEDVAPQGKRWVCCTACQGMGRVLLDVTEPPAVRPPSTPVDKDRYSPSLAAYDGGPAEEKKRGNNPFGPRGTLRCLNCQRRKKKVFPSLKLHPRTTTLMLCGSVPLRRSIAPVSDVVCEVSIVVPSSLLNNGPDPSPLSPQTTHVPCP